MPSDGRSGRSPAAIASLLRDHYLEAVARGYGEQDWSAVAHVVAANAGL